MLTILAVFVFFLSCAQFSRASKRKALQREQGVEGTTGQSPGRTCLSEDWLEEKEEREKEQRENRPRHVLLDLEYNYRYVFVYALYGEKNIKTPKYTQI